MQTFDLYREKSVCRADRRGVMRLTSGHLTCRPLHLSGPCPVADLRRRPTTDSQRARRRQRRNLRDQWTPRISNDHAATVLLLLL